MPVSRSVLPTPRRQHWFGVVIASCVAAAIALLAPANLPASDKSRGDNDGAIHVPAYVLPESFFLRDATRIALKNPHNLLHDEADAVKACPPLEHADRQDVPAIRRCQAEAFYKTPFYRQIREQFRVVVTSQEMAGVHTEVFLPAAGVLQKNKNRVLINLHGGSFDHGSRTMSHIESIPIAALGQIKVVSIDYRLAPEYAFPAASEDVVAVYRELIKDYPPKNIGMYGCSAGGLLTAQAVAWLQRKGLPLPGAIGMFCEGADYWTEGDSGYFITGASLRTSRDNPYFKGTDPDDPLVFPDRSAQVMAKFPPTLLISGTRDIALSSVVYTHSLLVAQGVEAELHVWEGLGHGFFLLNPELPESQEVRVTTVKFFDTHLGS